MTSEELHALGRRAVACKGWRWLGGMKVLDSFRVVESVVPMMFPVDTPDLTDPATLGCLLALVREACGDERTYVKPTDYGWHCVVAPKNNRAVVKAEGASEVEALVRALEIAP